MNGLIQLFNRLGLQRIAAMAVVAALMLGFFAFLIMRASSPQMAPLYTGLSFEDSSAIVAELQKQNVPNEIRGDGDTILGYAALFCLRCEIHSVGPFTWTRTPPTLTSNPPELMAFTWPSTGMPL